MSLIADLPPILPQGPHVTDDTHALFLEIRHTLNVAASNASAIEALLAAADERYCVALDPFRVLQNGATADSEGPQTHEAQIEVGNDPGLSRPKARKRGRKRVKRARKAKTPSQLEAGRKGQKGKGKETAYPPPFDYDKGGVAVSKKRSGEDEDEAYRLGYW